MAQEQDEAVPIRTVYMQDENGHILDTPLLVSIPADQKQVALLAWSEVGHNTRSEWKWFRLQNGDLIMGLYPTGSAYEEISDNIPI